MTRAPARPFITWLACEGLPTPLPAEGIESAMTKGKSTKDESQPLEKLIARLEEIVAALESGKEGLEKSIDLYAEGRRLGNDALKRLGQLEERIQMVMRDDGEKLELGPLDVPEEE